MTRHRNIFLHQKKSNFQHLYTQSCHATIAAPTPALAPHHHTLVTVDEDHTLDHGLLVEGAPQPARPHPTINPTITAAALLDPATTTATKTPHLIDDVTVHHPPTVAIAAALALRLEEKKQNRKWQAPAPVASNGKPKPHPLLRPKRSPELWTEAIATTRSLNDYAPGPLSEMMLGVNSEMITRVGMLIDQVWVGAMTLLANLGVILELGMEQMR